MRRNPGLAVIAAAALLAGCASQSNVPVERRVVVSGAGFEAVRGEAGLTVRTFVEDPAGTRREVVGATCQVGSSLYATTLVTPAQLVVPNFGPQSRNSVSTARPETCMDGRRAPSGPPGNMPRTTGRAARSTCPMARMVLTGRGGGRRSATAGIARPIPAPTIATWR